MHIKGRKKELNKPNKLTFEGFKYFWQMFESRFFVITIPVIQGKNTVVCYPKIIIITIIRNSSLNVLKRDEIIEIFATYIDKSTLNNSLIVVYTNVNSIRLIVFLSSDPPIPDHSFT